MVQLLLSQSTQSLLIEFTELQKIGLEMQKKQTLPFGSIKGVILVKGTWYFICNLQWPFDEEEKV